MRFPASRAIAMPADVAFDRIRLPTSTAFFRTRGFAAALRTACSTAALVATAATAFASRLARPAMSFSGEWTRQSGGRPALMP
jgi:hypothetical protein